MSSCFHYFLVLTGNFSAEVYLHCSVSVFGCIFSLFNILLKVVDKVNWWNVFLCVYVCIFLLRKIQCIELLGLCIIRDIKTSSCVTVSTVFSQRKLHLPPPVIYCKLVVFLFSYFPDINLCVWKHLISKEWEPKRSGAVEDWNIRKIYAKTPGF